MSKDALQLPLMGRVKMARNGNEKIKRCPACEVRDLRYRSRTNDYRCNNCKQVFPDMVRQSETVIANGEYAHATRRTYANIIFPGKGSRNI